MNFKVILFNQTVICQGERILMNYKYLNMEEYKRKQHFEYFNSLSYPYVGLTVDVDITDFIKGVKAKRLPFFSPFAIVCQKQQIVCPNSGREYGMIKIIEFDNCKTSHTVALEDGTYCYCTLDSRMSFSDFIPYAEREQEAARKKSEQSVKKRMQYLIKYLFPHCPGFLTPLLFSRYRFLQTAIQRITWGRYVERGHKTVMPVSALCHHGLVDGMHIAGFINRWTGRFWK